MARVSDSTSVSRSGRSGTPARPDTHVRPDTLARVRLDTHRPTRRPHPTRHPRPTRHHRPLPTRHHRSTRHPPPAHDPAPTSDPAPASDPTPTPARTGTRARPDTHTGDTHHTGNRHHTGAHHPHPRPITTPATHHRTGVRPTPATVPHPRPSHTRVRHPHPRPSHTRVRPTPASVSAPATVTTPISAVVAPVSQVFRWSVQNLLTSVFGAVGPVTQLQSDLYSFLLGLMGVVPVEDGFKGIDRAGRSVAVDESVASQLRLVLQLARVPGVRLAGNTAAATLGGIAASIFSATSEVGREALLPGMAPPAPMAPFPSAIPTGWRSLFRHAVNDLPRAASLWALAAVALPGFGGLVILTLAGVRIGYRQAKAGFALRTAGIARFARPGPLGVVRSGSLVVVRPPGLRAVRPPGLRAVPPGVKRRTSSQRRLAAVRRIGVVLKRHSATHPTSSVSCRQLDRLRCPRASARRSPLPCDPQWTPQKWPCWRVCSPRCWQSSA